MSPAATARRAATLLRRHTGLLSIAGGSAAGQLAAFLLLPVVSRLYDPSDFGALAVVTAYAVTLATFATLRLELAVPLARSDDDAFRLVFLALACSLLVAVLTGVGLAFFGEDAGRALGHADYSSVLWMMAPLMFAYAAYLALAQAAVRQERLTAVGTRNTLQPLVTTGAQVGLGIIWPTPAALIAGAALGYGTGAASLLRPRHARRARRELQPADLWETVSRHRRYPLTLLPAGVMNTLGLQLPVVFVAWRYGTDSAGSFGMALRVLGLPVTLIGAAMAQVYLARVAKQVRSGQANAWVSFVRATRALLLAGAGFLVAVLALAPWAFSTVLGAQWADAGRYAQVLAIAVASQLVAVPLSQTLIATGRLGLQLAWDATRLVVVTGALLLPATVGWNATATILTYSLASALMYAVMWLLCARAARSSDARAEPAAEPVTS
ncbi:lipopolysaccharide biosynthesis protein [Intrasporangium sp. YIM S08009]|uniref:lipopolysaccharide biosynthesis protein n=1 Tax=Intrasporangium zincisolvens TaxID=3080018 RepID=UPI002B05B196|nr:oligosaccharide flippase family protein [Intrasporangium sp. YIM S08009]